MTPHGLTMEDSLEDPLKRMQPSCVFLPRM